MRIVGEIRHPFLKITLMKHDRWLLKLEDGESEVVYRFRDEGGISSLKDANQILSKGLLKRAEVQLAKMRQDKFELLTKINENNNEDNFPNII